MSRHVKFGHYALKLLKLFFYFMTLIPKRSIKDYGILETKYDEEKHMLKEQLSFSNNSISFPLREKLTMHAET